MPYHAKWWSHGTANVAQGMGLRLLASPVLNGPLASETAVATVIYYIAIYYIAIYIPYIYTYIYIEIYIYI